MSYHFFGRSRISSAVHQEMVYLKSIWLCVLASPHFDYIHGCGQKKEIATVITAIKSCFEDTLSKCI